MQDFVIGILPRCFGREAALRKLSTLCDMQGTAITRAIAFEYTCGTEKELLLACLLFGVVKEMAAFARNIVSGDVNFTEKRLWLELSACLNQEVKKLEKVQSTSAPGLLRFKRWFSLQ